MLTRIYHFILYVIAIFLIVAALLFTITRLLTPLFNSHLDFFEKTTTRIVHNPVTIGRVEIGWQGIRPEIVLKNVTLARADTHQKFLHIKRFYLALDLFRSIWHREFLPSNLTLSGVSLSIQQLSATSYQINDMLVNTNGNSSSLNQAALQAWFLGQNTVSLQNIDVDFQDQHHAHYPITIKLLRLHNNNLAHTISGLILLRNTPSTLSLIVKAQGDLHDLSHLQVHAYVKAQNINLPKWLAGNTYYGYQLLNGYGQLEVWLNWHGGHWDNQVARLKIYDLQLKSFVNQKIFSLKSIDGAFSWQPLVNGWMIAGNQLQIISPTQIWPQSQFVVQKNYLSNNRVLTHCWLKFADLGMLRSLFEGSNLLDPKTQNLLQNLKMTGTINNAVYDQILQNQQLIQYQTHLNVNNLSIQNWQAVPGFNHVDAKVSANQDQGTLTLYSDNTVFTMPNLFSHSLIFGRLTANINWARKLTGWQMNINSFSMMNNDMTIHALGQFVWQKLSDLPYLNFEANLTLKDPTKVPYYLPIKGIGQHAENWLDQAFLGGKPILTKVLIRGNLAQFPFDHQPGTFQVLSQLNNLSLRYGDGWPILKNVTGTLQFDASKMVVNLTGASSLSTRITQAQVMIPRIKTGSPTVIEVSARLTDQAQGFLNYIEVSPMKDSLGKTLSRFKIDGPASLDLQLMLPLSDLKNTTTQGTLHFPSNTLHLMDWTEAITNLQGDLTFTQNTLESTQLKGQFFNHSFTAQMHTEKHANDFNIAKLDFTTILDVDALKAHYIPTLNLPVRGQSELNGSLSIHMNPQDNSQTTLKLSSSLNGVSIAYPTPFGKSASSNAPFNLMLNVGQDKPMQLFVNFANILHSVWIITADPQTSLYAATIHIGNELAYAPTQKGIVIKGYLPQFDWSAWQPVINVSTSNKSFTPNKNNATPTWLSQIKALPYSADVHIGELKLGALVLKPAQIIVARNPDSWLATLISTPIMGSITIPDSFPQLPLLGQFKQIDILPVDSDASTTKVSPKQIPPFVIDIDNLQYLHHDIGQIHMQVSKTKMGILINSLEVKAPLLSANLHGAWDDDENNKTRTTIQGAISSPNLQGLFNIWNFKSSLIANHAAAQVNWSWQDAPFRFTLKKLAGTASIKLENGWIIDLNEATTEKLNIGRLLTLLSIQHFMFHISDLSRQGYSFNTLTGHFNFYNGMIQTNDLATKGVVADIKAAGMVNVIKKTIDMKLGLVVNATSSLPIIATIASGFNPVVGIATWLADKAVHKVMASISTYKYEIKGPWSAPEVLNIDEPIPAAARA